MKAYREQMGLYSLNKGWKFSEQDLPVIELSNRHDEIYGYSKGGSARGPAFASFDDSKWETVDLPHDWLVEKDFSKDARATQGYKLRGKAWYRFKFSLPESERGKQILLEFEGMSCDAKIYVNGMLLKRNFSGYNSFCVDMSDMANFGIVPNVIAIYIDASLWEGWWYEGAGIYRNVWLSIKHPVHIDYQGVFLKPVKTEQGFDLHIETTLENTMEEATGFTLTHLLYDPAGNVERCISSEHTLSSYEKCILHTKVDALNPLLWDLNSPNLYQVKTMITIDGVEVDYQIHETGFRTLLFTPDQGFFLNGKPVKIKGFCNHQDHAGIGVAVPYRVKEYRIQKLKALGANGYRLAHNPDPEILRLCDRYGLLVMEENRTFSTEESNLDVVRSMVKTARNHPCVILYSAWNEEPLQGGEQGHRLAARLRATIHDLDDTRPVTGAMNGGYLEVVGGTTSVDVAGINYNPQMYDEFHKRFPYIPLVGSETASAFMVRGEYQTDEERHVIADYETECAKWGNTAIEAWKYIADRDFVMGGFIWTGFDYRGEPTPFEWPSVSTYFGTYDSCGFMKNACYLYKAMWQTEPFVHLASPWSNGQKPGEPVRILVITNLSQVEFFINGRSLGKQDASPFTPAVYEAAYEEGFIEAIGYRNGQACARDIQHSALAPTKLELTSPFASVHPDCSDAAIVNVALLDENGTLLTGHDDMIHFQVKNGRILGVGNGNPISHEPDKAPYRKLYHGLAQLIIAPTGLEDINVTAYTDTGLSATIQIPCVMIPVNPYMEPVEETIVSGWKRYYQLFDEMPDVHIQTDANDMNSFEPVIFTGNPQPELSGKLGKYAMFRTVYDFGESKQSRKLYFPEIFGHAFVYLNGTEIGKRTDDFGGSLLVPLDEHISGKNELTVVIWNGREDYPEAGICKPVAIV